MRYPEATDGTVGRLHFGAAPLGDARHRDRLVRVADQILARPAGTLPHEIPDPHRLDACYRLLRADDVTHAAVLETHVRLTRDRMATGPDPVGLVAHDDTLLDSSALAGPALGRIGNGNGRGFVCHNSLA